VADYQKLRNNNWKLLKQEPEPEEVQEGQQPEVDIVWNVYTEKGDAKSFALKVSIRLPIIPMSPQQG
jgi:hypothetical protein